MILISGKETSLKIKKEIAEAVAKIVAEGGRAPHLAAVLVGNDPASETYVANKVKSCQEVGITSTEFRLPEDTSEETLLELVGELNERDDIDGYIVQLPLPSQIDETKVLMKIDPEKDVDGFHPCNLGKMMTGLPTFLPATPAGILELLKRYGVETKGKRCVILGRSNIVGTPVSVLMSRKGVDATVTVCHSRTTNLKEITLSADILIVAIGQPRFVTEDMVKEGAVVIDVGIHRIPSSETKSGFRLVGDVDFDKVAPKCSYITPVPGGVGPMTIASLLMNTLKAYDFRMKKG